MRHANSLGLSQPFRIMPAMPKAPFQLRDLVIHTKMDIVGKVVFVDIKKGECRVSVDEDMPVENWKFTEVQLYEEDPRR